MQTRLRVHFVAAACMFVLVTTTSPAQISADSSNGPPVRTRNVFEFDSDPSGATVYYDSTILGKTPLTVRDLAFGRHVIRIESEGFAPFVDTVVVRFGGMFKITPRLAKFGGIEVLSVPSGVKVFLADTLAGYTPLQLNALTPGRTSIRLEDPIYKVWSYFVFIPEDAMTKITVPLEKRYGYLSVMTNNPECLISIDDEKVGVGSLSQVQLLSGMRSLSLEDPETGQKASSWLHIGTEAPVEALAEFGVTTYNPLISSCLLPGMGQYISGERGRGLLMMGGYLAAVTITFVEAVNYFKDLKEYEDVRRRYLDYNGTREGELIELRNSTRSSHEKAIRSRRMTIVSATVTGVIYAFNIYDILEHHMKGITIKIVPPGITLKNGQLKSNAFAAIRFEVTP